MTTQIQLRRGAAAQWTSVNPTLAEGEVGLETDTGRFKFGDGSTAWNALGYTSDLSDIDTLVKLNTVVTDATLDDAGASRTPSAHGNEAHTSTFVDASGAAAAAPVQSVNTETGAVVLDAGDVGADPAGTAASEVAAIPSDGTAATPSLRTLGTAGAQAAAGDDARLSDARTPTAHAGTHATAGSDPVAPSDIGAEPAGTAASEVSAHEAAADPHSGAYATSAQGSLADTAVQPGDDAADLGSDTATDGHVLTADGAGGAAWEAAAAGGGVVAPLVAGRYYGTIVPHSAGGTIEQAENLMVMQLMYTPTPITIDRIGTRITGAGEAGSVIRYGIYEAITRDDPGGLIVDAGTLDATITGTQRVVTLSQAMPAGYFWLAAVCQNAPTTRPTTIQVASSGSGSLHSFVGLPTPNMGQTPLGGRVAGVSGALPATVSVIFDTSPNHMRIAFRVA